MLIYKKRNIMKTIKAKFAPDDKTFKDMGIVYLKTDNQDFIDGLAKITKYKEMTIYLDKYNHLYQELEQDPQKYDFTFDTSSDMVRLVQDDNLPFLEKLK